MTNSKMMIKKQEIIKATKIKDIKLLNDFEIIGYSLNAIGKDKSKIMKIKGGSQKIFETKAIIGAGTGLGMSILVFNKESKSYIPIKSEGGHSDFPLEDEFDSKIAAFLKKRRLIKGNVTYEDLISGKGIENIYSYLLSTKEFYPTDIQKDISVAKNKPELISKYRKDDPICNKTMDKFAIYYARAARNFALETLASGGLYIAGGIAPKNKELFKSKTFIKEFHHSSLYKKVIKKIPIYMITDYRCSIYGAAYAALNAKD
jgi:glucokinase